MNLKNIFPAIITCSLFLYSSHGCASVLGDALTMLKNKLSDLSFLLSDKQKTQQHITDQYLRDLAKKEIDKLNDQELKEHFNVIIKLSNKHLDSYIAKLKTYLLSSFKGILSSYFTKLLTVKEKNMHPMVQKLRENIELEPPKNQKELFSHPGFLTLIDQDKEFESSKDANEAIKKVLAKTLRKKKNEPYESVHRILEENITPIQKTKKLVIEQSFQSLLKRKIFQLESENQRDGYRCGYFTAFNGSLAFKQALLGKKLYEEPPQELADEKKLFANELKDTMDYFSSKDTTMQSEVEKQIKNKISQIKILSKWPDVKEQWLTDPEVGLLFNVFLYHYKNSIKIDVALKNWYDAGIFVIKKSDFFYCFSSFAFDQNDKIKPLRILYPYLVNVKKFQETGLPQMISINTDGHWIAGIMSIYGLFIIDSLNGTQTNEEAIKKLYDIYVGKEDAFKQSIEELKKSNKKSQVARIINLLKEFSSQKPLTYPDGKPLTW